MSLRDNAEVSIGWVWYSALGLAIVLGITFMTLKLKPEFLGLEREAYKASYQYTEAKESELLTYVAEYDKLGVQIAKLEADPAKATIVSQLRLQREGLVERLRTESQRIPAGEVPASVTAIIHGSR